MFLYHYSVEPYPVLKTLEQQGKPIPDIAKQNPNYGKHVSFFHDKLPLDILPEIFPKDHFIWINGKVVYEHQVKIEDLDLFYWKAVETEVEDFYRRIPDLIFDHTPAFKAYKWYRKSFNYEGETLDSLIKYLKKLSKVSLRDAFLSIPNKVNDPKRTGYAKPNLYQYASNIPHIMTYVKSPIPVHQIMKSKVGSLKQTPLKSLNW